ncbi:RICIN domain-containing protein [Streptomyces sp. NRRL S-1022]|uniref:RICIN domain-containing protein n=1 Tax=Streptomyces sp. NRRL S-1022 TaxID=1463880 RepID=UPI00131E94DF|nr:RICIN domain-containing protein [Streptomyces sp. NRRL S-1022]
MGETVRTPHTLSVAAAFLTATLALTSAAPAEAASTLRHKNARSGYCLGMHSSRSTVNLINCSSRRSLWRPYATTRVGGVKYVKLRNPYNGKCLGVSHASAASGAALAWGNCTSTRDHSQLWRSKYVSSSRYLLVNAHSGKCAGTVRSSTAYMTQVIQGRCASGTGSTQLWKELSG